ncbi:MAG: class I tRNA ligase family protein, partial [Candidatus Omnitrophota bacterium]
IGRTLRLVEDDQIDPSFGTGLVKVTPAHDPVDFSIGKKFDLEFINIMNDDATMNDNAAEYKGMDRFKARDAIVKCLTEKDLIEKIEKYEVSAGRCYRCDTVIEPRLSLQWFVKMKPLAGPAIQAVVDDKIKFYPDRWKKVYLNWMENIQDWCISRQIWWGHRIPVYYCSKCYDSMSQSSIGIMVSKVRPEKCAACGATEIVQDPDVLDTWFSSWLWPFATFKWPFNKERLGSGYQQAESELKYFYPTDTLTTASEILFFWVARMIMAGYEFMGDIPFKDVVIHGTVRDSKGIKMSKSLGNTIDPLDVIDKFGADALRFSLMLLAASGSDVFLSDEKFLVGRNFCNKIWNAVRFVLSKIENSAVELTDIEPSAYDGTDAWILGKLNSAINDVDKFVQAYRMNDAAKTIYEFFWHDFCDWYLETIKNSFNQTKAKTALRVIVSTMKLAHPIIPFITDKILDIIGDTVVALKPYLSFTDGWPEEIELTDDILDERQSTESLFETIRAIRNIKIDLGLGNKKTGLKVCANNKKLWKKNETWLLALSGSTDIMFADELKRVLYKNELWSLDFSVGELETENFLASLDKKISNLMRVSGQLEKRLRNEGFIKNASKEIVAQEKEKSSQIKDELQRLKELSNAFK